MWAETKISMGRKGRSLRSEASWGIGKKEKRTKTEWRKNPPLWFGLARSTWQGRPGSRKPVGETERRKCSFPLILPLSTSVAPSYLLLVLLLLLDCSIDGGLAFSPCRYWAKRRTHETLRPRRDPLLLPYLYFFFFHFVASLVPLPP